MTIYQGKVIDSVTFLPIPNVNLAISPGHILDYNTQSSFSTDSNGQFSYISQIPGQYAL